jgi:hypothetical protein
MADVHDMEWDPTKKTVQRISKELLQHRSKRARVVGEVVGLNTYNKRGQKIMNTIANTFNKNHFRRLLIR